jgi:hypothetical protein
MSVFLNITPEFVHDVHLNDAGDCPTENCEICANRDKLTMLKSAAEESLIELAEHGFLQCITSPRCGTCTTCRASDIASELAAARGAE